MHPNLSGKDAPAGARLHHDFDGARGLILVVGRGFWTEAYIDEHFARLGQLIEQVRSSGRDIRALVDLSEAPVQSAEVAARITAQTRRIYQVEDRIAIVARSSLMKMQMRRAGEPLNLELFPSRGAAEAWLLAPAGARYQPAS